LAATQSNMLPLGTKAPYFNLFNPASGAYMSLENLRGEKATLIAFICNHCPYVIHIGNKFAEISDKYMNLGVSFIGINSNDVIKYPEDSPENMVLTANKFRFNFPYLFDDTQEIAKSYAAACTPDLFLFDDKLELVYRGQFDNSRPKNGVPVTGEDLCNAIDSVLAGKPVTDKQIPSIGCNIKWK